MVKNFNWGHGIVLALASFMAFILYMVFIFPNGKQNAEMISDNYYEEEMQYQQVIDAKNNASQLSEIPKYSESDAGITLSFPSSIQVDQGKVDFSLFRTDDKNLDVNKSIVLDANKSFVIPKQVLVAGSYTLKVKWKEKRNDFQVDYDIQWK
ncbi:MAG: FixH family protein [Bacteroidetes bacterium]|nr:FixH family protein [Bacteroidota bacterium]